MGDTSYYAALFLIRIIKCCFQNTPRKLLAVMIIKREKKKGKKFLISRVFKDNGWGESVFAMLGKIKV